MSIAWDFLLCYLQHIGRLRSLEIIHVSLSDDLFTTYDDFKIPNYCFSTLYPSLRLTSIEASNAIAIASSSSLSPRIA